MTALLLAVAGIHLDAPITLTAQSQIIDPADLAELHIDPAWVQATTEKMPALMSTAAALLG